MTQPDAFNPSDPLDRLESRSIHILREAYREIDSLAMLWSIGKDSTVMLWLARKAFLGQVPFPLVHIDTRFKIPEMIAYRDRLVKQWNLPLLFGTNQEAVDQKQTYPDGKLDRLGCCNKLKTQPLAATLSGKGKRYRWNATAEKYLEDTDTRPYRGVIVGIRADEEGSRSKERYFSPRTADNQWDFADQPPEFWQQYNTTLPPHCHVRIHPLLDWTETNIWQYIAREKIPVVSLYFDRGNGTRYRSLGCAPCTTPISSQAKTPSDILVELSSGALKHVPERSGRAQDEEQGGLETLRKDGYM